MTTGKPIHHILLADDDQDHGLLFQRILNNIDYTIRLSWVKDGIELLNFLRMNEVDLIFLDLKMPCKNGHECLREIKTDSGLMQIPVIVYSSSSQMADIRRSFFNKADVYMVKPFSSDHLMKALQSVISIGRKGLESIRKHYFMNNQFVPYTSTI
jgi:CheY-like chemotaxis protein